MLANGDYNTDFFSNVIVYVYITYFYDFVKMY